MADDEKAKKTQWLQVRVEREFKEAIERAAVSDGRTMSNWVIMACREKLEREAGDH